MSESVALMTAVNALILGAFIYSLWIFNKHKKSVLVEQLRHDFFLIATGLGVIGLSAALDLVCKHILPHFKDFKALIAVFEFAHHNILWVLVPVGAVLVALGFSKSILQASQVIGMLKEREGHIQQIGDEVLTTLSKLNQQESELVEQNSRFQAALENMSQGLCMFDGDQRLIVSNDLYASMYGLSKEQLKPGITFREILEHRVRNEVFSGGDSESYIEERLAAIAENKPSTKIQRLVDGRVIAIAHRPLPNGGWVATHEDISTLAEAEAMNQRLATIVENAINEIYIYDSQTLTCLQANRSACNNLGYDSEEIEKLKPFDLLDEYTEETFNDLISPLRSGEKEHLKIETVQRRKDGSHYDVSLTIQQIQSQNQHVISIIAEDITEQKASRRELESLNEKITAERKRFRDLYRNTPVMMHSIGKDGALIEASGHWEEVLGYRPDEVIGRKTTEFLTPESRKYAEETVLPAFWKDGAVHDIHYQMIRKDGSIIDVKLSAIVDGELDDDDAKSLAVVIDVTDQMRAERRLKQSEALFSQAFQANPVPFSISGPGGEIYDLNDAWLNMMGYTREEAIGNSAVKLGVWAKPDERARFVSLLKKQGSVENFVTQYRTKHGELRDVVVSGQWAPVRGEYRMFNISYDVTDKLKAEREIMETNARLMKERERLNKIYRTSPVMLHSIDENGTILEVSDYWCEKMGYTHEEVIGRKIFDFMSPESAEYKRRENMPKLFSGGTIDNVYYTYIRKDGTPMEVRHSAITGTGTGMENDLMQSFSVIFDVTDQIKAERELVKHRDHLQALVNEATADLKAQAQELEAALAKEKELNELQRQFVSMASHEFRTPLAIIDSTAQRLKKNVSQSKTEEALRRVDKIREAVIRMTRLMESTLTAARLEEGKVAVELQPVEISELIAEICQRYQELATTHRIKCRLKNLPKTINADSSALDQVLTNLLSNAVKYSPDSPDIEVNAYGEGDHVVLKVTDHGLGIDEEDLPKMFGRFFRAKTSTGIVGTGIGLNLVKTLVELHGGAVTIDSKKGEGSTFTVRLPVAGPQKNAEAA